MISCAALFPGCHDWTAFSAAQSDAESRIRTITHLEIREYTDQRSHSPMIEIEVTADGFLRYMVRSIAGTLMAVGRGEIDEQQIERAIAEGDRTQAGPTAPPCGLTLLSVRYR
jgi:tRNA pseudouridine38-40 synthase